MLSAATHNVSPRLDAMRSRTTPLVFQALFDSVDVTGAAMPFERNSEIYGENDPADYVYKVLSGTVRTCKLLTDGRRQIDAFYLPGDMFGLELGDTHCCSAEAIGDFVVLVVKRSLLLAAAEKSNGSRPQAVVADRARSAPRPAPHAAADQERAGARRRVPPGDGGTAVRRQRGRAADVAPGHRRLSRPDHRDSVAHAVAVRRRRDDCAPDLAPRGPAQSPAARPAQRLSRA